MACSALGIRSGVAALWGMDSARLARQVERILRADYCPRCGCAVGTWGQCRNYGCEQVHMRRPKPAENKKRKAVKN